NGVPGVSDFANARAHQRWKAGEDVLGKRSRGSTRRARERQDDGLLMAAAAVEDERAIVGIRPPPRPHAPEERDRGQDDGRQPCSQPPHGSITSPTYGCPVASSFPPGCCLVTSGGRHSRCTRRSKTLA